VQLSLTAPPVIVVSLTLREFSFLAHSSCSELPGDTPARLTFDTHD